MSKTAFRATVAVLLLPAVLAGCDAIYDDTKGWAKRLEASLLRAANGQTDPTTGETAREDPQPAEMAAPQTVPVGPVTTAALAAPAGQAASLPDAPEGVMAATSDALVASEEGAPPLPKAKPEPMDRAAQAPGPAAGSADAALVSVMLHLSSLRSEDAAKRQWHELQASFPDPLGRLQAEFQRTDLGEQGTFYRVLAGPLPSHDEAATVCAALKAKSAEQYCRILPQKSDGKPKA